MNEHQQRLIASISKSIAMMCFRDTILEDIHVGSEPVSHTGDFTDVVVIDAKGRRIAWSDVSRIGTEEVGDLMRQMVNRLYQPAVHVPGEGTRPALRGDDGPSASRGDESWDEPELDEIILSGIESSRRRTEEED